MKRFTIVFLCLALASLACLSTAIATSQSGGSFVSVAPTVSERDKVATRSNKPRLDLDAVKVCARVLAETAENLRFGPGIDEHIETHLLNGDHVVVIDKTDPDWWMVSSSQYTGYARSKYLELDDCEVNDGP